jgi:PKD repeat protein
MRNRKIKLFAIILCCLAAGVALPQVSGIDDQGFWFHNEDIAGGCTLGVASGYVAVDGRPMLCKVRDIPSDERQQLCYTSGSPYNYIGVRSEGGPIFMGLNEAGLATGNSLVKLTPEVAYNSLFQRHILRNYDTLDQIRNYIQSQVNAGTCNVSGCFAFIDADGDAVIFEVNRADWFWEYDTINPDREAEGYLGFVVRANEFHQRSDGTDDTSIGGRYFSGTDNVLGLVDIDELSAKTIIQGNDDSNGFEFVRYGPGRALSEISRSSSRSAIAVHGVAPNEDPELATMWVILGQPDYGIAVPTWVKVSTIPQCLSSGDMYDRAQSLYNKGNEATTQASTFPVEAHLFDVVINTFLPHWRAEGVPSVAEMTRIEHQMANDAYSLLYCLDNYQSDNMAPAVTFTASSLGLTVDFTLLANDMDGTINEIKWNFGDDQTSTETSPSHIYPESGTYLVSCTVTDDDGVSITGWEYRTVHARKIGIEEWNRSFGGTDSDVARSVQQTEDGGYILAGYTESFAGSTDAWLIKTDVSGNEVWNKTFDVSDHDYAYSVQQTKGGSYVLAGYTESFGAGLMDAWLITGYSLLKPIHFPLPQQIPPFRTSWLGPYRMSWDTKTFGGTDRDVASSVQQTEDGGYVLAGYTESFGAGRCDAWLIKTDKSGNEVWNKTFGGASWDVAHSVQQTKDGGYVLAGSTRSFAADWDDVWLIKTDKSGNEVWNKTFGRTGWDGALSVQQTKDGGYVLAGYTRSFGRRWDDAWLIKTDAFGNKLWDKTFDVTDHDYAYSVQQTKDDGYIVGGYTGPDEGPECDALLIKTDASGNKLWRILINFFFKNLMIPIAHILGFR